MGVDLQAVWEITESYLPELQTVVLAMIQELEPVDPTHSNNDVKNPSSEK